MPELTRYEQWASARIAALEAQLAQSQWATGILAKHHRRLAGRLSERKAKIRSLEAKNERLREKLRRANEMLARCGEWLETVDWEDPEDGPNNDDMNFLHMGVQAGEE